ncbi:MAG: hypothetical protein VX000_16375, partial [Myxococcota bacterium]|nr:hypothetical protein [Myxococcota bacterium]
MELRAGLVACLLSVAACGDKAASPSGADDTAAHVPGGSGSGDTGSGGGTEGGSGGGTGGDTPSSEQPPTMSAADAHCYQHETGEARWIWVVSGTADDPQ